jgi:hypothetical protein
MIYKIFGKDIPISFGMLFMEYFWQKVTEDLTGSDLVAILVFYGNKTHCKLEGGAPLYNLINEVYKDIVAHPKDEGTERLVSDFQETQEYKSIIEAAEQNKKKLLLKKSGGTRSGR